MTPMQRIDAITEKAGDACVAILKAEVEKVLRRSPEVSVAWIGGGRQYSRPARERQGFKPLLVTADIAEGLAEISLVDSGAFPGTGWWRV